MADLGYYNEIRIGSCVELLVDFAEYLQLSAHQFSCLCYKLRVRGEQIKPISKSPNFSIISIKQGALVNDLGLSDFQVQKYIEYKREMENSTEYWEWMGKMRSK